MEFCASDLNELERQLHSWSAPVPARGEGRRKEHTEPWIAACTLRALATAGLLQYPLRCCTGERPDLELRTADWTAGVEITEAVPEPWARADAIANREGTRGALQPEPFVTLASETSSKDLRALIASPPRAAGYAGDEVERAWRPHVLESLGRKRSSAAKAGFRRFENTWLLVYDNVPLPALHVGAAVALLEQHTLMLEPFSGLLILRDRELVVKTATCTRIIDVPPMGRSPHRR